jgi:hypothetical protein
MKSSEMIINATDVKGEPLSFRYPRRILKFVRRLLAPPRAFITWVLFRIAPKRLHFFLFNIPWGICGANDLARVALSETGTTFASAPRIVGASHAVQESPVIHSKFTAPKRTAEMFVASIECGYSTRLGMNLSADGRLISDVSYETSLPANNRSTKGISPWPTVDSVRFPVRIHRVESPVITLTSRHQYNYFHWLFDVLPRVHLAKMAGVGAAIYYVEYSHLFQKESLDLLGIREDVVIDACKNPTIQASTLFIPSYPEAFTGIPPLACNFLRSSLLVECQRRFPRLAGSQGTKIYISRRDATMRRLTNEKDLIDLLERYGFAVLESGGMSMAEQIMMFAEADVIIGNHGAGLANIVFCQKGTTVIEISSPRYIFGVFHDLATRCDLEYYLIFGQDADLSHDYGWTHQADDYSVDLALVQRAVEIAISRGRSLIATERLMRSECWP